MGTRRDIEVSSLVVNGGNPRIFPVEGEDEAIYSILTDQRLSSKKNKIVTLAQDIAANGLNSTEAFVVSSEPDGRYLVREGNRRATALKLAYDPSLVPPDFPDVAKAMRELQGKMPTSVEGAIVSDDEDEINHIIETRHSGSQGGIGVEPWDSAQKSRFRQQREKRPSGVVPLIDQLHHLFSDDREFTEALAKAHPTGLVRMLGTPEVREYCGVNRSDDLFEYLGGYDDEIKRVVTYVANHSVGDYYTAEKRKKLVREFAGVQGALWGQDPSEAGSKEDSQRTGGSAGGEGEGSGGDPSQDEAVEPGRSGPRPKGHPFDRKTVIPATGNPLPTEGNPNAGHLYRELRELDASKYPMACGLLLRGLVEIAAGTCLRRYLDVPEYQKLQEKALGDRINEACTRLVRDRTVTISNNDVDYMRKFAKNKDAGVPVTVSSLNSIAHGDSGWPDGTALISLWDKIYKVVLAMLDDRK
ncbi:MAG: hypothetical protein J6D54_01215 [Olsenella sp.]|nr:hypothetical protein [Olsenella sp.]